MLFAVGPRPAQITWHDHCIQGPLFQYLYMFSSTLAPRGHLLVSQCGMDHQKSTILLIFAALSVKSCGLLWRPISILPSKKPEPSTSRGFFDGRNARLRVIRPTSSDEVESQQTTSTSAGTDRTPDGRALSLHSHDQQAAAPYY